VQQGEIRKLGSTVQKVIKHQKERFAQLRTFLSSSPANKVIIAGSANRPEAMSLGTKRGRDSWWDPNDYAAMNANLLSLCRRLKDEFPDRVSFGIVGNEASMPPSKNVYHVWGANWGNWNLQEGVMISGGGQAAVMGIQRPGVFGIVTTSF
jgi:hypothetical protein